MTIEELAARSGVTTRNIRNYQTRRLLPPPLVERRVGLYDDRHLARLRLIARLQEQGFSLAGIAELLQAWERGMGLDDLLGFEAALTQPWTDEEPEVIPAAVLLERFPEAAADPSLTTRAAALGLIEPAGDDVRILRPRLVAVGTELVAAGVPVAAALEELAILATEADRVAARFVRLFEEYVWDPFIRRGMPADELPRVTEALHRMRPLAQRAMAATLAVAMQDHVTRAAAARIGRLGDTTPDSAAS